MCKNCYNTKLLVSKCSYLCPEYREPCCDSISKSPYVCNHCSRQRTCNKNKAYYIAQNADKSTRIFYCNPNSSWQKGRIERNHEYIRYVIPKGQSLDNYKQKDACILMNHINSEARDSLNGCTPFRLSKLLLNNRLHRLLCLWEIPADQVNLKSSLLKK